MVQVKEGPSGSFEYMLGGGAGIYANYAYTPLSSQHRSHDVVPGKHNLTERYVARQLKTTNLGHGSQDFKPRDKHSYAIRGLVHQGQQRANIKREYFLPKLQPSPVTKTRASTAEPPSIKLTRSVRAALQLPSLTEADKTAGLPTLRSSIYSGGFARSVAASRSANESIVKSLALVDTCPQHRGNLREKNIESVKPNQKFTPTPTLATHGHEAKYYTELERLKKNRLYDTYQNIMQSHRLRRGELLKERLEVGERVRKQNYTHMDRITAHALGRNTKEPIKIKIILNIKPEETTPVKESANYDYYKVQDVEQIYDNRGKRKTAHGRPLEDTSLGSAARAWKNIPQSYLNVWNSKIKQAD